MAKERCPNATFDILMVKNKEGKASIMGRENWTVQFP
jgi:hypothetical protein